MQTYNTDRVQGDTPTTAGALKVGDVIRLYSGLEDTATVASVECETVQFARRVCIITLDSGLPMPQIEVSSRIDLATAGPRKAVA